MAKKQRKPEQPATTGPPNADDALATLAQFDDHLADLQRPVVKQVQQFLDQLEGQSFGSLEANQAVASALQFLLNRLGLRVECPRCGRPAIFRCRSSRSPTTPSFQFEHFEEGRRTNHVGTTTWPALRLVPAPPDRRRKSSASE